MSARECLPSDGLRAGVAMCVYNGAAFLREQLDSIAAQTVAPLRLAVVDDGSSDGSWELLQDWAKRAPFEVRLQRNDHRLGVVRNFERAIALLGEDVDIVFLADQDDRWFPEKVQVFLERFIQDASLGLLHSDARLIDGQGQDMGRQLFETLLVSEQEREHVAAGRAWQVYAKRNLVTGAACALRRSLLREALPFSPLWVHDEWLAFIAALVSRVELLDRPTMAYRLHQSNTVGLPIPDLAWRLRTTWQAFTRPTAERQRLRAERLRAVLAQVRWQECQREQQDYLERAADHAFFRGHLPRNPLRRLAGVWRRWRAKDYHRWSNGEISMLHDLLVPY